VKKYHRSVSNVQHLTPHEEEFSLLGRFISERPFLNERINDFLAAKKKKTASYYVFPTKMPLSLPVVFLPTCASGSGSSASMTVRSKQGKRHSVKKREQVNKRFREHRQIKPS
jgi:hypothetical protein